MENQVQKQGSAIEFNVDTKFSKYKKIETCSMGRNENG